MLMNRWLTLLFSQFESSTKDSTVLSLQQSTNFTTWPPRDPSMVCLLTRTKSDFLFNVDARRCKRSDKEKIWSNMTGKTVSYPRLARASDKISFLFKYSSSDKEISHPFAPDRGAKNEKPISIWRSSTAFFVINMQRYPKLSWRNTSLRSDPLFFSLNDHAENRLVFLALCFLFWKQSDFDRHVISISGKWFCSMPSDIDDASSLSISIRVSDAIDEKHFSIRSILIDNRSSAPLEIGSSTKSDGEVRAVRKKPICIIINRLVHWRDERSFDMNSLFIRYLTLIMSREIDVWRAQI